MHELTPSDVRAEVRRLVSLASAGDHQAYAKLVERYKESLYRLALRILRRPADAEDAVQEAFIKAYIHLDSYDGAYSFYTWTSTILSNVCHSALRARDWHVAPAPDRLLQGLRSLTTFEDPESAALIGSRDEILRRAIKDLPDKYAHVLILRYWHDLTYQEVAAATDQSMAAVKTQIHRATTILRETLMGLRLDLGPEPA